MPRNSAPENAVIFGCSSTRLTEEERAFFAKANPLGFILFARNIESPNQVRDLISSLQDCVERAAPVLVDQEGGRVQRFKPPYWRGRPPMAIFGALAKRDRELGLRAARLNAHLIAAELASLGVTADCAPLLDVPVDGAHDIIGDRALATTPDMVADLGRAVLDGLLDGGVTPIVKHIPGHGRALVDSHLDLPVVEADYQTLKNWDFEPFRRLADAPWAMTAHVVYKAIDPDRPATTSAAVIERVIRGEIGCRSVLLSDDLSMKALKGSFADRTEATLRAGCDIALHCNGDMDEMTAIASAVKPLTDAALERLRRASDMERHVALRAGAQDELDNWLAVAAS